MSAPEKAVVLSPDAEADIDSILLFTWQQWGEEQRDRYEAALESAIAALADFPEIGSRRPQIFPDCRIRSVERHIVYDRIVGDVIDVVRILHERTDPARHFRP